MSKHRMHKPIFETLINTTALALSAFAVTQLTKADCSTQEWVRALILIIVAMGLEFFKYVGRQSKLW